MRKWESGSINTGRIICIYTHTHTHTLTQKTCGTEPRTSFQTIHQQSISNTQLPRRCKIQPHNRDVYIESHPSLRLSARFQLLKTIRRLICIMVAFKQVMQIQPRKHEKEKKYQILTFCYELHASPVHAIGSGKDRVVPASTPKENRKKK